MKKSNVVVLAVLAVLLAGAFVFGGRLYRSSQETHKTETVSPLTLQDRLVGPADHTKGPSLARVVVVEFLDPQCSTCRAMHPITQKILGEFEGQIYYVLRYMPFHPNAPYACSVLEAAARQGKFWEALDVVFEKQESWGDPVHPQPELILKELEKIGLDAKRLESERQDPAIAAHVERDRNDGLAVGVDSTPTYFVNGKMLAELGEAALRKAIQGELNP